MTFSFIITSILLSALLFESTIFAKTNIESFLTDINLQYSDSGINRVNCLYVINLEHRSQKWLTTKAIFNSYGIFPNRVNAINGWMLNEQEKQVLMGIYPLRLRGGQIGCILSHVSTLQHAFRNNYEVVWICEDDIEICENPHQLSDLILTLSEIDPEWDILYTDSDSKNESGIIVPSLGSDFRPDFPHMDLDYYINNEIINHDFIRKNQRFGAYSYILSKRGVEKILRHFIDNYLWTSYDIEIHYILGIRQYCIRRDLVSINWKLPSDTEYNFE
jgi:GR25 family glycosyltransferase involved in LPS biosynthesis